LRKEIDNLKFEIREIEETLRSAKSNTVKNIVRPYGKEELNE